MTTPTTDITLTDLHDRIADLECKIDDILAIMQTVGDALGSAAAHPVLGQFLSPLGKMP